MQYKLADPDAKKNFRKNREHFRELGIDKELLQIQNWK